MFHSPKLVDKTNWISGDMKALNTYSVVQYGSKISVTRNDYGFFIRPVQTFMYLFEVKLGWDQDLEFLCCFPVERG